MQDVFYRFRSEELSSTQSVDFSMFYEIDEE